MALVKSSPRHLDWPELLTWPWEEDARTLARRMFGLREGMLHVEEYQDDDAYVIRAEMPGIDPDKDVEITVSDGVLNITAERREQTEKKDKSGYRSEFRYGAFQRRFALPPGTGEQDVSASYEKGILEIRIKTPAEERTSARRIQIRRG